MEQPMLPPPFPELERHDTVRNLETREGAPPCASISHSPNTVPHRVVGPHEN